MPFIAKSSIDKLMESTEIVDVIQSYISLEKHGPVYKACCPFHNERTPSFTITPKLGIYKCFGCGEGGNALDFIINYKKLSYVDAMEELAQISNFQLEYIKGNEVSYREQQEKEISLYDINKNVSDYYHKRLLQDDGWASTHLFSRQLTEADIKFWQLGYASNDFAISNILKDTGKTTEGIELGIIKKSDKGISYDNFQDRIIIPIQDKNGKVIAFGGKSISTDKKIPKYKNSDDSPIYNKSKSLFGLYKNADAIRKANCAYLVEGYFDCISICRVGIQNTVASCGTALTDEQAKLLRKYCEKVVVFYDGDAAGWKATIKAVDILLRHSFHIYLVASPGRIFTDESDKMFNEDPDTIAQKYEITQFLDEHTTEALPFIAAHLYEQADDTFQKGQAIEKIAELLSIIPNVISKQEYIREVAELIGINKTTLKKEVEKKDNERIKKLAEKIQDKDRKNDTDFPNEDARMSWIKYGFYEDDRFDKFGYWFNDPKGKKHLSNFVMRSLYLIEGSRADESKRIIELKNELNIERIIDMRVKSLNSIVEFKSIVEGLGKFLFRGTMSYLDLLKLELFETEKHCKEIKNIGWQSEGFYAFANGIFDTEEFTEIDSHGVVLHKEQYYFIPALSKIYAHIKNAYKNDKKFVHIPNKNTNFEKWAKLYNEAHNYPDNPNGTLSILFFIGSLFRDHIFDVCENYFPILFLFGKPSTGKTKMAEGLLSLFGIKQDVLNLSNTTKAGISKKMAEFNNAIAFLDEYKNVLDQEIIQFSKSIADGQGRNKSDLTADEKTTSTPINSAAIIAGQEKPTVDIALFTRCILCTFLEREFNKSAFDEISDMQKNGLTSVTLEILRNRIFIEQNFKTYFRNAQKEFKSLCELHNLELKKKRQQPIQIQERLVTSMSILFAVYAVLENRLVFPFKREEVKSILLNQILKQGEMITYSNDVSMFWDYVQDLFVAGELQDGIHYCIKKEYIANAMQLRDILYIQFSTVHKLYLIMHRKATSKPGMDKDSLLNYLKNTPEYIKTVSNARFGRIQNSAHLFDYEALNICLIKSDDTQPEISIQTKIEQIF